MSRVSAGVVLAIALVFPDGAQAYGRALRQPDTKAEKTRIQTLLVQLADQARSSDNLAFSVRAQAQAASLLWPYDSERARMIFRRAFDALSTPESDKSEVLRRGAQVASNPSSRFQLRVELFNHVAARDPELVEELARKLASLSDSQKDVLQIERSGDGRTIADAPMTSSQLRVDPEQRELLISVALQIVERDPNRAMSLGQLSLEQGIDNRAPFISPNFTRLLSLLQGIDMTLARLLLSSALARLERTHTPALADIHALGSYLVSLQGNWSREGVTRAEIERFLRLSLDRIMRYREQPGDGLLAVSDKALRLDEKSTIYFIGRQLKDLLGRFMPDRLPQLRLRMSELTQPSPTDRAIDPGLVDAIGPADIERQARESTDAVERDSLYARTALGWLALGEWAEAQNTASKIGLTATRDRVLSQIARRHTADGRVEEAVAVARRIEDVETRANVLVRSAYAALKTRNRTRASELLNEAENETLKGEPSVERTQGLLSVVNAFSTFDTVRAFEVMQSAVKSLNQIIAPAEARPIEPGAVTPPESQNEVLRPEGVHNLGLEDTLATLARADFDGALLLAQQVTGKDVSVIAQLAVCRGGLNGDDDEPGEEDGPARP